MNKHFHPEDLRNPDRWRVKSLHCPNCGSEEILHSDNMYYKYRCGKCGTEFGRNFNRLPY